MPCGDGHKGSTAFRADGQVKKGATVTGKSERAGACWQVVVRPELAEHMMTTGDIGLPASTLLRRFPLVRPCTTPSAGVWHMR